MSRRKRRNHAPSFKAQVAVAALKGDKTLAELAQQFDIHTHQIVDWKQHLIEHADQAFGAGAEPAAPAVDIDQLHATIGRLKVENDFLEHALGKAGLLSAKR